MSNYVFLLNAHAPIVVVNDGIIRSATYDAYRLYASAMQPIAIQADVNSASFTSKIPLEPAYRTGRPTVTAKRLDVPATKSRNGKKLTVSLLNLDKTRPARVRLDILGQKILHGGTLQTLYIRDMEAVNSVAEPNRVRSITKPLKNRPDAIEIQPYSVNILELNVDI